MLPLTPLAIVGLHAGLLELYFDSELASAWALAQINAGRADAWLVDLLESGGCTDACAAISMGYQTLDCRTANIDAVSLRLGFAFLVHARGERSLAELLQGAGSLADGNGYFNPDCETFYLLLNEIDGGGPTVPSTVSLTARVATVFATHATFAAQAEVEIRASMAST